MPEKPEVLTIAMQIPTSIIDELGAQAFIDEAASAATAAATMMVKQYLEREPPHLGGNGSDPRKKEKA